MEYPKMNRLVEEMDTYFNNPHPTSRIDQMSEVSERLSPMHALVRLFGDFDDQAYNGGIQQYVENGYHTADSTSLFDKVDTDNFEVLDDLITRLQVFNQPLQNSTVESVIKLLNKIESNISIDEDEFEDDWFGDEDTINENYGQLTDDSISALDKLSDQYYELREEMLSILESQVK